MVSGQSHLIEALRASPRPLSTGMNSSDAQQTAEEPRGSNSSDADNVQIIQTENPGAEDSALRQRAPPSRPRTETLGSLLASGMQSGNSEQRSAATGSILSRIVQDAGSRDQLAGSFQLNSNIQRQQTILPKPDGFSQNCGHDTRGQLDNRRGNPAGGQLQFLTSRTSQSQPRINRPSGTIFSTSNTPITGFP